MKHNWKSMRLTSRMCLLLLANLYCVNAMASLIDNGDFESSPLDKSWFVYGGTGSLSSSTVEKHGGQTSGLMEKRSQAYVGAGQELKDKLKAGITYTISAWVKPKNAPNTTEYFKMNIKQEDGKGAQFLEVDTLPVRNANWTKLSAPFKLTTSGTLKTLSLYIYNTNIKSDFYVDDVVIEPPVVYTPTASSPTDFIRAKGRDLVVGKNETPILLMGVNFISYADDDEPVDVVLRSKNYDEIDFKRVADMGMNTIRLTMWYKIFEDDAKPGVYKQEGWEWLETRIVWARKYGVSLILDMHAPPGGYQSWDYSGGFWDSNAKYRNRLNDLWKAIAQRYKDEPFIAAYDLINEPAPKSTKQWSTYAQELIDVIRTVDKNHLIIVEEAFVEGSEFFILADKNVMYDFHVYETWAYSNQFMYGRGMGYGGRYPDPEISVYPWKYKDADLVMNDSIPTGNSDWTYYEGKLHKMTNDKVFAAIPAFVAKDNSGKVYFDDFVVKEYSPDGKVVSQLIHMQVDRKPAEWYFLSGTDPFLSYAEEWKGKKVGSGGGTQSIEKTGRVGSNALSIVKATGTYTLQNSKMIFPVKVGYSYQINGWIKGENSKGSAMLGLHFQQFGEGEKRQPFTKAYLEKLLLDYGVDYYMQKNVPLNIGEFGVSIASYQNDRGGERMVADFLDLFKKYRVNAQYFNYHGIDYGIYTNLLGFPYPEAATVNLVNTFSSKLGGTTRLEPAPPPDANAANPDSSVGNQDVPDGTVIPDTTLAPPTQAEAPIQVVRPETNTQPPFSEVCVATYTAVDADNSQFLFPCVEAGGKIYSVSMEQRFSPFIFLTDIEKIHLAQGIAPDNNCLARYISSDSSLYTPCVRDPSTAVIWEAYFYHLTPTALFVIDMPRVKQR